MSRPFIIQPPRPALNSDIGKRYSFTPDPTDDYDQVSTLGTPVWSNFILLAEGTDVGNPTTLNPNNGKRNLRIDTCLIVVQLPKIVQKTEIQGRNGTVKEYISRGDYQITVKGSINTPYPMVFPKDDIDLLNQFGKLQTSIPVSSKYLDIFGITDIVLESITVSEKLGYRNEVDFEIQAVSDQPLEFSLNPNRGL